MKWLLSEASADIQDRGVKQANARSSLCLLNKRNEALTSNIRNNILFSGARNQNSKEAKKHARLHYNSIRKMTTDVIKIAVNTRLK